MKTGATPLPRRRSAGFARACLVALLVARGVAPAGAAESAPVVPTQADEIVEHLPTHFGDAAQRRAARAAERQQRAELQRHPDELGLAVQTAEAAIARARVQGDPRELGSAQAALAPWWGLDAPPPAVRLLRATVRQSQHDFDSARADLDALLVEAPDAPPVPLALRAQALLTRAAIGQVRGRYADVLRDCRRLAGPEFAGLGAAIRLSAQACLAEIASLQGHADAAAATLARLAGDDVERTLARPATDEVDRTLARPAGDAAFPDTTPAWLSLMRAELAARRGDPQAGALFARALRAQPEVYTLCAYADWLLDQHRAAEVVTLLRGHEAADPALLRLALAWRQLHGRQHPLTVQASAMLAERYDAALLRGDRSHGREQARHALELRGRPREALALAQRNWAVQREPADALVLVRCALAAQRPDAAEPVWQFLRDNGGQDVRLGAIPAGGDKS